MATTDNLTAKAPLFKPPEDLDAKIKKRQVYIAVMCMPHEIEALLNKMDAADYEFVSSTLIYVNVQDELKLRNIAHLGNQQSVKTLPVLLNIFSSVEDEEPFDEPEPETKEVNHGSEKDSEE